LFLMLAHSATFAARFRTSAAASGVFMKQFVRYGSQIQKQYRIQTFSNFLSAAAILGALLLFGIDFSFLWAFLAFFLGYIPMIGLLIACIPAIFLAYIQYGLGTAVILLLLIILLNTAMDNLVTPRFMGDGLNLPIVFIMIGFIFWGWIYGPLGALLAVPLTLLVRALFESSRATRFQARLMTSVDEPDSGGEAGANGSSPSVTVIAP
jgi:predicted PurR-regulated permease PerM